MLILHFLPKKIEKSLQDLILLKINTKKCKAIHFSYLSLNIILV